MEKAVLNLDRLNLVSDTEQGSDRKNESAVERTVPKAFIKRTANQVLKDASELEISNMLFSEFVFEQELTIIYTKPNVGKSMLAFQMAHLISTGNHLDGLVNESNAQRVLYFDLELSDLQFQSRYATEYTDVDGKRNFNNHFKFNDNLEILKFSDAQCPRGMDKTEYIFEQIKEECEDSEAKILFIDNISWLTMKGLERSDHAKFLMEKLLQLVKQEKYTIVVIAHTPKISDNRPIYLTDLAGSGGIGAFCDSAFIINDSPAQGKTSKYLKQTKCRSAEKVFDERNVLNVVLEELHPNFIGVKVVDVDEDYLIELNHFSRAEIKTTAVYNEDQKIEAKLKIKKAIEDDSSISSRKLEKISGVSHQTANIYRKEIEQNPQLFDGYMNPKKEKDGDS